MYMRHIEYSTAKKKSKIKQNKGIYNEHGMATELL